MLRSVALVAIFGVAVLTIALARAADYGTADEARAMLEKAVAAVKADKTKARDMFNNGEGGFKDRDLYVFCANASDGVLTAHPYLKGEHLQDIKGKKGFPLGQEIMRTATEGKISEVTYWLPRPGSDKPLEKHTFFTRVGDQDLRGRLLQVNPVYRWVAADLLVMTCFKRSGPTEISPVNGRLIR